MLEDEFNEPIHALTTAKLKVNKKKNRYLNILPCKRKHKKSTQKERK